MPGVPPELPLATQRGTGKMVSLNPSWYSKPGSHDLRRDAGVAFDHTPVAGANALRPKKRKKQVRYDAIATEVADLRQVQETSSRIVAAADLAGMLEEVLHAALQVEGAEQGLLSLYVNGSSGLRVKASHGFSEEFLGNLKALPSGRGFCEISLKEGRRIIVEDANSDPAFDDCRGLVELGQFRSAHCTPLITREGRGIGVLSTYSSVRRTPTEREIRLLDLYARLAADAIEGARLREAAQLELEERRRAEKRLNLQYAVSRSLAESASLEEGAVRVIQSICETAAWDVGAVWQLDVASNALQCVGFWPGSGERYAAFAEETRKSRLMRGAGVPGRVWLAGEPLWLLEFSPGWADQKRMTAARGAGLHAVLAIPIRVGREVIGVLELYSAGGLGPDDEFLRVMESLGGQLGHFIEHRRGELDRKQVSDRLVQILSLMPAGVYACDEQGRLTVFNRRAAELWGREPQLLDDDAKYCGCYRAYTPDGKLVVPSESPMSAAVHQGVSFRNIEAVVERPDGSRFFASFDIDPVLDERGKPAGAISVFQDMTDRIEASRALRLNEERFRLTTSSELITLYEQDLELRYIWLHPLRDREAHAIGKTDLELLPNAEGECITAYKREVLHDGVCRRREVKVTVAGEEKYYDVVICPRRNEAGEIVGVSGMALDVSGRRQAEALHRRLAAIVESSDDAIVSKDLNSVITSWNSGAERLYGYTADEAIGQSIEILLPSDRTTEAFETLARIKRGERVAHAETVRRRKDGSHIEISLTVSPVRDHDGNIVGASKIARDITEKKRAERALRETKEQLARAIEELELRVDERTASLRAAIEQMEEFSYGVSHDLRAPLRAMQGYASALQEDYGPKLDGEGRDYLQRIIRNSMRMDRLIQDTLTYTRVGAATIQLQPIPLTQLVREIIQQYPEMQPPRAHISIPEPLLGVLGHEASLSQAIANLLSNAVKFVAPGETPRVVVRTERVDADVKLIVEDNGIGIGPEHQHRIFGMFERIHPPSAYEGTGIGLAIVRKAAERMGGRVGLESDGAHGCRFWIQLPAA